MGDEHDEFMDARDEFIQSDDVEEAVYDKIVKASEDLKLYGDWSDSVTYFLEWLDEVDNIFDVMGTKDPMRVKVIVSGFRPSEQDWWDNLQWCRVQEGEQEITTWSEMRREMYHKFVKDSYTLSFRQSVGMSVKQYTKIFKQLCYRAEIDDTEQQKVNRYVRGLQGVIQYEFTNRCITDICMKEAIEIACKSEEQWRQDGIHIWERRRMEEKNNADLNFSNTHLVGH